jgi:hypothetical protein
VKYVGVIFDKKIHGDYIQNTKTIAAKTLRTFINIYPLLKSGRLSVGTKLTLYKAMLRSIMTDARPSWEFVADSYLLELQCLQNEVLRTIGSLPGPPPTRDLHCDVQNFVLIRFRYKTMQATADSHTKS